MDFSSYHNIRRRVVISLHQPTAPDIVPPECPLVAVVRVDFNRPLIMHNTQTAQDLTVHSVCAGDAIEGQVLPI